MITTTATNLPRLVACKGSRLIGQTVPKRETDAKKQEEKDKGIAAHFMAEQVCGGHFELEELIDRKAPNGIYMTDDMAEHVQVYLDEIVNFNTSVEADTSWAGTGFQINGRADSVTHDLSGGGYMKIADFKYGWGIVEPKDNWTLISHAIGEVIRSGAGWPNVIDFVIVQPRPIHRDGKVRTWRITGQELYELYQQIITELSAPDDLLVTNPHCLRCDGGSVCPALNKVAKIAVDLSERAFDEQLSDHELGVDLIVLQTAMTRLKSRIDATEDLAKHRSKAGGIIPHFQTEASFGRTTWKKDVTAESLKAITGVDATKPKLLTPKQYAAKGVSQAVIDLFTYEPSHGVKLVQITANERAKNMFGKGT